MGHTHNPFPRPPEHERIKVQPEKPAEQDALKKPTVWVICEDTNGGDYGLPFAAFNTKEAAEKAARDIWGSFGAVTELELRAHSWDERDMTDRAMTNYPDTTPAVTQGQIEAALREYGVQDPKPIHHQRMLAALSAAVKERGVAPPQPEWRGIESAKLIERIKHGIDYRLNECLCEMKPNYDDSITGFNEAWSIVRKYFQSPWLVAPAAPDPVKSDAPAPTSLHWLGDGNFGGCAKDTRGCVAYFNTQAECEAFMAHAAAMGTTDNG